MDKKILSKIGNIKVPLFIPKRSKGHVEVIGCGEVSTFGKVDSYDFIKVLVAEAREVWDREKVVKITKLLARTAKLIELEFRVVFNYTVDRSTPTYEITYFELPCFFKTNFKKGRKVKFSLGIEIPIRINSDSSNIVTTGKLLIQIEEPVIRSFEDLLDFVQKNANIKLYPIKSQKDSKEIGNIIDMGMKPQEYIDMLTSSVSRSKVLGKKCYISIQATDVYNMFNLESTVTW